MTYFELSFSLIDLMLQSSMAQQENVIIIVCP